MSPLAPSQAHSSAQPYPTLGTPAQAQCSAHSLAPRSAASLTSNELLKPIASKTQRTPVLTMHRPRYSNDEQQIIGARWRPASKAAVTASADQEQVTYGID
jgi:hypothetical protein